MGTYYSVKLVAQKGLNREKLHNEIETSLKRVNSVFSTYIKSSELSKLNQLSPGQESRLSPEMARLLELSKKIYKESGGYFDVTVGPIVNAWGFGPDGKQKRPSEEKLEKLKNTIGMELFEVRDLAFSKKTQGLYIDLSAIAKGYGVDHVHEMLADKGFSSSLVEIGGEVRASGKKPDGTSWLIGIEKPSESLGAGIQAIVTLSDMAMATSGSYRNFVKYGDEIFSHTIDPVTGRPAHNNVISVTVLASTCAEADAYATAFLAMGREKGLALAKKLGFPAYFIVKKEGESVIMATDTFNTYLREI